MKHDYRKKILIICALILALGSITIYTLLKEKDKTYKDWKSYNLIMHALGGIHGSIYTNTKEAFIENYARNSRVFEVDLYLTSDEKLVAFHQNKILTSNIIQNNLSLNDIFLDDFYDYHALTPLCFEDLIDLMIEYPDTFFITDTKNTDEEMIIKQFSIIYNIVNEKDTDLLKRIIPQIYHQDMYEYIEKIYSFKEYIWTLYKTPEITKEEIVAFLNKYPKITAITVPYDSLILTQEFIEELTKQNILIYVHTLNNMKDINYYYDLGIWGFYTDYVTEEFLELNKSLRFNHD